MPAAAAAAARRMLLMVTSEKDGGPGGRAVPGKLLFRSSVDTRARGRTRARPGAQGHTHAVRPGIAAGSEQRTTRHAARGEALACDHRRRSGSHDVRERAGRIPAPLEAPRSRRNPARSISPGLPVPGLLSPVVRDAEEDRSSRTQASRPPKTTRTSRPVHHMCCIAYTARARSWPPKHQPAPWPGPGEPPRTSTRAVPRSNGTGSGAPGLLGRGAPGAPDPRADRRVRAAGGRGQARRPSVAGLRTPLRLRPATLCSGSRSPGAGRAAAPGPRRRRPYIDRQVLAQQIAREEEQRRALADFLGGWGAAGGASV